MHKRLARAYRERGGRGCKGHGRRDRSTHCSLLRKSMQSSATPLSASTNKLLKRSEKLTITSILQAPLVRTLLERGADPNLQNFRGDGAIHIASRAGNVEVYWSPLTPSCPRETPPHFVTGHPFLRRAFSGRHRPQMHVEGQILKTTKYVRKECKRRANNYPRQVVTALLDYDVHVGQRNWQELTAFGEARMNSQFEVRETPSSNNSKGDADSCWKTLP